MTRPPTEYEKIRLRTLRRACELVDVDATSEDRRGTSGTRGNQWTITGRVNGTITIEQQSAYLTGACRKFRQEYDRAVRGGVIKKREGR